MKISDDPFSEEGEGEEEDYSYETETGSDEEEGETGETLTDSEEGEYLDDDEDSDMFDSEGESDDIPPPLKFKLKDIPIKTIQNQTEAVSAVEISDKFIAIGTYQGSLYILAIEGQKAYEFRNVHPNNMINDISIDAEGEYIASCASDGRVVIRSLLKSSDITEYNLESPVVSCALDPQYKTTHRLLVGLQNGEVAVHKLGVFKIKTKKKVIQESHPIKKVCWRNNHIMWIFRGLIRIRNWNQQRNGLQIKLPEPENEDYYQLPVSVTWVGKPKEGSHHTLEEFYGTNLGTILHSDIRYNQDTKKETVHRTLYNMTESTPFCGAAAFNGGESIFYLTLARNGKIGFRVYSPESHLKADIPGVVVQQYQDLHLRTLPYEEKYYIFTSNKMIVGSKTTVVDNVNWLVERKKFQAALDLAQVHKEKLEGTEFSLTKLGEAYLTNLMSQGRYDWVRTYLPSVADKDKDIWQKYILEFIDKHQLEVILPQIPQEEPQLNATVYENILNYLLQSNISLFKTYIKEWNPKIYDIKNILHCVQVKYDNTQDGSLRELIALLHEYDGNYAAALDLYFNMTGEKLYLFDFIEKNNLYAHVSNRVSELLDIDKNRCLDLLTKHTDEILVEDVIKQLHDDLGYSSKTKSQSRKQIQLLDYMDKLHKKNETLVEEHHDLLLELYAQYRTDDLVEFVTKPRKYVVEKAIAICKNQLNAHQQAPSKEDAINLNKAIVYLQADHLGLYEESLNIIVDKLADVKLAIKHVNEKDAHLWKELIKKAVVSKNDKFLQDLMKDIGQYFSNEFTPLDLISELPDNREIRGLRDYMAGIIKAHSLQFSMNDNSQGILMEDTRLQSKTFHKKQRRAVVISTDIICMGCKHPIKTVKPSILFFCEHAYHQDCFQKSQQYLHENSRRKYAKNKKLSNRQSKQEEEVASLPMRCPLCESLSKK